MTLEEKMNEIWEDAREEGLEQGREEGLEQGREEGIKEGIRENTLQVAKAMKEKGYDIQDIIEITNLLKEQIESL